MKISPLKNMNFCAKAVFNRAAALESYDRQIKAIEEQKKLAEAFLDMPETQFTTRCLIGQLPENDEVVLHAGFDTDKKEREMTSDIQMQNLWVSYKPHEKESIEKYNNLSPETKYALSHYEVQSGNIIDTWKLLDWLYRAVDIFGRK